MPGNAGTGRSRPAAARGPDENGEYRGAVRGAAARAVMPEESLAPAGGEPGAPGAGPAGPAGRGGRPAGGAGRGRAPGAMDRLSWGLAVVAGTLLGVLALIISLDIASRQVPGFSMPWSLDVAEYLLYLITFLAAPWVLLTGGHITVDLVVARLAPPARRRADLSANAIGALAALVLFWFACRVWWRSFSDGTLVYETFVFPEWWLFSAAPPVFLLLAAIFVRRVVRPPDAGASTDLGPGRSADAL